MDEKIKRIFQFGGVVIKRTERGVETNVPRLVTKHSPTGFEFGYRGSGPADLALNILEAYLRGIGWEGSTRKVMKGEAFEVSLGMYQFFKEKYIDPMHREGGKIHIREISKFVEEHTHISPD